MRCSSDQILKGIFRPISLIRGGILLVVNTKLLFDPNVKKNQVRDRLIVTNRVRI